MGVVSYLRSSSKRLSVSISSSAGEFSIPSIFTAHFRHMFLPPILCVAVVPPSPPPAHKAWHLKSPQAATLTPSPLVAWVESAPPINVGFGFHSDEEEVFDTGPVCQPHSRGFVLMGLIITEVGSRHLLWSLEVQVSALSFAAYSS